MKKYFVPYFLDKTTFEYNLVPTQYSNLHYTLVDSSEKFETKELAEDYIKTMMLRERNEAICIILEIYKSV